MKIGDIVKQTDTIVKMKGREPSKVLGVVVGLRKEEDDRIPPQWQKFLGSSVDVMWANGKLSEGFAENSLEVVNSYRDENA